MTNSMKMMKLDIMAMKSQHLLLVTVAVMVFFSFQGMPLTVMCITAAWVSAWTTSSLFSIQEKNSLERLYGSLSIGLKDIVLGRYLFMLLVYGISLLIGVASFSCLVIFQNKAADFVEILPGLGVSLLFLSVITGLQIPMLFKLGYSKGRFWAFVPFAIIIALVAVPPLVAAFPNVLEFLKTNQGVLAVGSIVAGCVVLFCSYRVSIVAYRKRR